MKIIRVIALILVGLSFGTVNTQAKYLDDETDLVYYGYRYYNPTGGRWLTRDPISELGFDPVAANKRNLDREDNMLSVILNGEPLKPGNIGAFLTWLNDQANRQLPAQGTSQDSGDDVLNGLRYASNPYLFNDNDSLDKYDATGLWPLPIYYICISCKLGTYQCVGLFNTPTRLPRNPAKLYLCLKVAQTLMDAGCLSANHGMFDAGCSDVLGCLKKHW